MSDYTTEEIKKMRELSQEIQKLEAQRISLMRGNRLVEAIATQESIKRKIGEFRKLAYINKN